MVREESVRSGGAGMGAGNLFFWQRVGRRLSEYEVCFADGWDIDSWFCRGGAREFLRSSYFIPFHYLTS